MEKYINPCLVDPMPGWEEAWEREEAGKGNTKKGAIWYGVERFLSSRFEGNEKIAKLATAFKSILQMENEEQKPIRFDDNQTPIKWRNEEDRIFHQSYLDYHIERKPKGKEKRQTTENSEETR